MVLITTSEGFEMDHEEMAEKFSNVSMLSVRQAEVFILRKVADNDVEKTAKIMEVSPGTVSTYSSLYREKFQKAEATLNLRDKWS